jgi:hypothetical protein
MDYRVNNILAGLSAQSLGFATSIACDGTDEIVLTTQRFDTVEADGAGFLANIVATLASGKYIDYKIDMAQSEDGTNFDTAVSVLSCVRVTGGSGTTTNYLNAMVNVDLMNTKRYIRFIVTPVFESTATDTANISGLILSKPKY